ncbi:ABC-three component system protein [Acetobacter malorum]|uniref:ABC-three component system protein n=1 Tax=Acetobacter malorum TaxID=178901 RepID=UPI001C4F87F2|nr:ABC-three component system protein [Acetobacter malorum]
MATLIANSDFKSIAPKAISEVASADHVQAGLPIPKAIRVQVFSPDDWEGFTEEWASSLKGYAIVRRFAGAGDMGLDVTGFTAAAGFSAPWDNYQCKRYDHPLRPSDIHVEIGKIIYYSWLGEFTVPRKHYFAASKDIGTTAAKLLLDPMNLKESTRHAWERQCRHEITKTADVALTGSLLSYFNAFDFSIFGSKSVLELIAQHETTKFHAIRFGGGLPPRPASHVPPAEPAEHESRYIRQLLNAYGDHLGEQLPDVAALASKQPLHRDFSRQRERFYSAEALRNFSRDTVPEGTFDALQEEVFQGVVDICEGSHLTGFERMKATVSQAAQVVLTSNPLAPATRVQDRQGICHQLANEDRLYWIPTDE